MLTVNQYRHLESTETGERAWCKFPPPIIRELLQTLPALRVPVMNLKRYWANLRNSLLHLFLQLISECYHLLETLLTVGSSEGCRLKDNFVLLKPGSVTIRHCRTRWPLHEGQLMEIFPRKYWVLLPLSQLYLSVSFKHATAPHLTLALVTGCHTHCTLPRSCTHTHAHFRSSLAARVAPHHLWCFNPPPDHCWRGGTRTSPEQSKQVRASERGGEKKKTVRGGKERPAEGKVSKLMNQQWQVITFIFTQHQYLPELSAWGNWGSGGVGGVRERNRERKQE